MNERALHEKGSSEKGIYKFISLSNESRRNNTIMECINLLKALFRAGVARQVAVCVYATDFAEWWIALVIPPSRKSLNEKWAGISLPLLPIGSLGSVIMKKTRKIYESLWDAPVLRFCSRPSSSAKRAFLTKGFKCSRVVKYFALITFRAPHKQ